MKKLLSVILAGAVLAALAGCSNEKSASTGASVAAVSAESSKTEESAAAPEGSEAPASSEAAATADESIPENTTSSEESASEESVGGDESVDVSQMTDEEIYDKMVERSLLSVGDMTRMANVLKKARDGGELTAAYIGGSITEGYNAGTEDFYAKICTDWLEEQFPDSAVTGVNAGISGTPSILGNLRLERDVLHYDPDIVFVEFAVNDGTEQEYKDAYESLVRTLLTQDRDIAVVLLFTILKNGHTCQPHMSQIGEKYGLPMISVPDSIGKEIEEGRMTWEKYSNDESHPNAYGHACIRDFVVNYYEQVIPVMDEKAGEVDKNLPDPVFSGKYANMHYMDSATMSVLLENFVENDTHSSFHNGWMYKGKDGGSLKFSVKCSVLEMVFKANNNATYGDADIYVDGEKVKTVSSNMSDGWANPVTSYLIDDDKSAEHEVEIRIEGGKNCAFFVLGFGYCD